MVVRFKTRVVWALVGIFLTAVLWVMNVELTYRHNVRRGLPTNFHLVPEHPVRRWRA